jgi:hypothetical protein
VPDTIPRLNSLPDPPLTPNKDKGDVFPAPLGQTEVLVNVETTSIVTTDDHLNNNNSVLHNSSYNVCSPNHHPLLNRIDRLLPVSPSSGLLGILT